MYTVPGMYGTYNNVIGLGAGGLQQNIGMVVPQGQVPLHQYYPGYAGHVMMYTNSPPSSPQPSPPSSPMAQVHSGMQHSQGQSHIVASANNIAMMLAHQHPDGVDDDESKLQRVLRDASDQIREAKRVVTKSMMRNHKQKAVQVQLLRGLGATAVESIPFMRPSNARDALRSVSLLISTVSSKLVPEMRTQRQKHIVYVMRIMETYVRSMLSLVSKKEPDQEENYDVSDEVSNDAIERILVKLQEAEAWIPTRLNDDNGSNKSIDEILNACIEITTKLESLRASKNASSSSSASTSP